MPQSWRFRKSRMQRGERAGHGRSGLSERECACWGLAVLGGLRRPVQEPRGAENSERNLYTLARSRMWRRALARGIRKIGGVGVPCPGARNGGNYAAGLTRLHSAEP